MKNILLLLIPIVVVSCKAGQKETSFLQKSLPAKVIEITPPSGYINDSFDSSSFSFFVQHLSLKSDDNIIAFNGDSIYNPIYRVLAVVDLPLLFNQDLEQCADFAMRINAEYFKQNNRLDSLYLFNYDGKKICFSTSHKSYQQFLKSVFVNANSHSIKRGCKVINENQLQPGDMIVQNDNGGVGHVSMIVNSCTNQNGLRLFLIGFSFMPAQQFHIEDAMKYGVEGWFTFSGYLEFLKNHLDLGEPVLRRF